MLNMRKKHIALLTLILSALAFSGCASKHGLTDSGTTQLGPQSVNVLGLYSYDQESYRPTGPNTIAISTDELYVRRNYSGDRASFLWGLVTLKDY